MRRLISRLGIMFALVALVGLMAGPVSASNGTHGDMYVLDGETGFINETHAGNVFMSGDSTLVVNGTLNGNVLKEDGGLATVKVAGTVNGDIQDKGDGDLVVTGSTVETVTTFGTINGNVEEDKYGDCTVEDDEGQLTVNGNTEKCVIGDD